MGEIIIAAIELAGQRTEVLSLRCAQVGWASFSARCRSQNAQLGQLISLSKRDGARLGGDPANAASSGAETSAFIGVADISQVALARWNRKSRRILNNLLIHNSDPDDRSATNRNTTCTHETVDKAVLFPVVH